jgi:ketosteroid isomerase-like protein
MKWLVMGALVWASSGCVREAKAPMDLARLEQDLMEADRHFKEDTEQRGVDGWVDAFANDGRMFGGGIVEGPDAIREAMAVLDDPDFSLEWEPVFAEVSSSGDLGYTHGTYRRSFTGEDGETVVQTGRYVTIWRHDESGAWKAVLDIGDPDRPVAP